MTGDDVKRVFKPHVSGEDLLIGNGQSVDVEFFATVLFSAAPPTPTYAELAAIDGGSKGYIPFFDQCKTEGLIV